MKNKKEEVQEVAQEVQEAAKTVAKKATKSLKSLKKSAKNILKYAKYAPDTITIPSSVALIAGGSAVSTVGLIVTMAGGFITRGGIEVGKATQNKKFKAAIEKFDKATKVVQENIRNAIETGTNNSIADVISENINETTDNLAPEAA